MCFPWPKGISKRQTHSDERRVHQTVTVMVYLCRAPHIPWSVWRSRNFAHVYELSVRGSSKSRKTQHLFASACIVLSWSSLFTQQRRTKNQTCTKFHPNSVYIPVFRCVRGCFHGEWRSVFSFLLPTEAFASTGKCVEKSSNRKIKVEILCIVVCLGSVFPVTLTTFRMVQEPGKCCSLKKEALLARLLCKEWHCCDPSDGNYGKDTFFKRFGEMKVVCTIQEYFIFSLVIQMIALQKIRQVE